jgi:hypothetical protein
MIIKKLEVKGTDKQTALVDLDIGLNVIAGASDTGKSYITKCFQFIFGTETPPKAIDQAKGYTHLVVSFETKNGERFVLSRELKEKADIVCTEIDNDNLETVLKPTHKGTPNLSEFFMSKFGLDNKILAKGLESMNHVSLTLRIFERILLVDEERIISENSPFGRGQNTERTIEYSFIKTLLTGEDDADIQETKKNKLSKESIKKKLGNFEDFLEKFFPSDEDSQNSLEQMDKELDKFEAAYNQAEKELNALIQSNNSIVREREQLKKKADLVGRKLADDTALLGRFKMLEKKYISDRERLEANTESATYMEQHRIANCPLCGSEIDQDDEIDIDAIEKANSSEILKIDAHLEDLRSTQADVKKSLELNKDQFSSIMEKISDLDRELGGSIGSKVKENRKILNDLDAARSEFRKERDSETKRQEIFEEIGRLQAEYDEIRDTYQIDDFSREAYQLSKKIAEILTRWDFPNGNKTAFDLDARDIVIGGKPRSHFGKGYRAICFSAILIGLMEYLYSKGRHPGFIILDSPLTTYRKQDESLEIDNEEVFLANNLIYAFYRDLCEFYKDKQIIVLDNQEPDEDLYPFMNYIHFSGNESVGRYGFFPVS